VKIIDPVGEAGVRVNSILAIGESDFLLYDETNRGGRENNPVLDATKVNRGGSNIPLCRRGGRGIKGYGKVVFADGDFQGIATLGMILDLGLNRDPG
jgi:hypothetical protein